MEADKGLGGGAKRVVVIGGGVAGSLLVKSLQFNADVTLIDPKEYYEITWAGLRSMVEPSFANRSVINHRDYFTNGRLIVSTAINITDTEVVTADGVHVIYDYLVIATGHMDPVPRSRADRLDEYKEENEKIKSARSILIIGGGPTGVELAGEIAADFPEKELTLVHRGSRLLEFIGQKASDKTLKWLKSKRVDVKLEQAVDIDSPVDRSLGNTYHTSAGEAIRADCHFVCIGKPLRSEWLRNTVLRNVLDTQGRLMVDAYLRVKGHNNVFAIGDVTNIQEIKQGYLAQKHASVVAQNLKLLMTGGMEHKMAIYKPGCSMAIVSLGRRDAVAQFPYTTMIGIIPGIIKSRDLFVGKTRKQLGLGAEPHDQDT